MTKYSFQHIAEIVNGELIHSYHDDQIEHLIIDSRKIIFPKTSLFFALAGLTRDGHSFIEELYAKGVRNFVISKPVSLSDFPEGNFIKVHEALEALQQLAAFHRKQFNIPVIGITGSNGKTIVKEWLNQLLEEDFNIVRSPKSFNSQIGVPLSVWQLNEHHQLGIFEAGISLPGEMEKLEKIIQPTIGILTNIGEAHSEGFKDQDEKLKEKFKLFDSVETLICSAALAHAVYPERSRGAVKLQTWKLKSLHKKENFTEVDFVIDDKETSLSVPFTDEASIQNCLTCYAVLSYLKIPHEKIQKRILQLKHVSMRLELKKGINHCSIINDSYSADISSLKIALDFLAEQRQHPSRSVIISDFVQSGMKEDTLYSHIAGALEQHGVDRIIGIGEKISAHREKFKKISRQNFYSSTNEFLSDFRDAAFSNEAILIKGARVFAFEKIDRLLGEKLHHTVLEIDLNALKHNLKQYQNHLHKGTKVMAMVKAFAYGSGSYEIASVLQFNKVDYLAVAYADEAVELRKAGINMPIMVMNTESDSFENLIEYDLQPVIYSTALLNDLKSFLIDEDIRHFPVHIEINTGMNRLGFDPVQIDPSIETFSSATFRIQSVFSHLAASEDPQQNEFTISQSVIFNQVCDQLQRRISYPFLRHIANSAAILRFPELQMNMVRLGIGLYGIDSGNTKELELQEVSTLRSTIAQIRHIKKGETVSYGRKGIADDDKIIATVRIGYADGYPRSLGNGVGKMFVSGQLAPIIGTICMDMTMIDVTNIASVQEEDEVIVFGKELSAEQVARWAGTIPYEILTGVSQRVKRIYYQD